MAAPMKFIFPSSASNVCRASETSDIESRRRRKKQSIIQQKTLDRHQKCLVTGEHGSGKTALLFQCAVSLALEGHHVAFITPKKFQSVPPAVEGASTPDPLLMKQINIMYFQDRSALISYLSQLHTKTSLPHAIIVDDLDYYTTHPQAADLPSTVSVLCSYLVDAVTFVSNKTAHACDGNADDCFLLASISCSAQGEFQVPHVYRFFLTSELHITGVDPQENIYQLTSQSNGIPHNDCIITYKLGQTIKVLDILTGEEAFSQITCNTEEGDGHG